ncbi:MAG: prepilin-type N-terminal cleavage/methylation domain-containing protein [Minisyncoccia bacterium]
MKNFYIKLISCINKNARPNLVRGFTLLETIIYIALFSLLVTSGFTAVYQMIYSVSTLAVKNVTEEESGFVLRKLNWAFSGLDRLESPIIGGTGCNKNISVLKNGSVNPIRIRMNSISSKNYIEIQDDGITYYPITTENASTTCLDFSIISGNPFGISATTTINGKNFTLTKYVRH